MKGDGEGKMNAVEKQCDVHVCSRPAIVGSSQSVALLGANFLLTSRTPQFIHVSPACDIVKRFFIESTPLVCHRYQRCRNCRIYRLLLQQLFFLATSSSKGFERDEIAQTQARRGSAGLTSVAAVPVMARAQRLKVRSWIVYWIKTRIWLWNWTMCIRRMNAHTRHAASPAIWTPKASATADHKPASQRLRSARRPCSFV